MTAVDLNPAVTPETIATTICVVRWATAQRPPEELTHRIKLDMWLRRPAPKGPFSSYILDHTVPLELGGCALCRTNLQLQTIAEARKKDAEENTLHRMVCRHQVSLETAQARMRRWTP